MIPTNPGITSAIDNPNSPKILIAMISMFSSCPNIPFFLSKRHGTSNIYFTILTYFPKNIPLANDHAPFDNPDTESTAPVDDIISSTTVGVDVSTPIQTIVDTRPLMINMPLNVVAKIYISIVMINCVKQIESSFLNSSPIDDCLGLSDIDAPIYHHDIPTSTIRSITLLVMDNRITNHAIPIAIIPMTPSTSVKEASTPINAPLFPIGAILARTFESAKFSYTFFGWI